MTEVKEEAYPSPALDPLDLSTNSPRSITSHAETETVSSHTNSYAGDISSAEQPDTGDQLQDIQTATVNPTRIINYPSPSTTDSTSNGNNNNNSKTSMSSMQIHDSSAEGLLKAMSGGEGLLKTMANGVGPPPIPPAGMSPFDVGAVMYPHMIQQAQWAAAMAAIPRNNNMGNVFPGMMDAVRMSAAAAATLSPPSLPPLTQPSSISSLSTLGPFLTTNPYKRRRATPQKKSPTTSTGGNATSSDGEEASPDNKSSTVPSEQKDDAYWERRKKNNEAAKRSRDTRRQKEAAVGIRAAELSQENLQLRTEVSLLKGQLTSLQTILMSKRP